MSLTPNEIALRPRFQLELSRSKEAVLDILENSGQYPFLVQRMDEHIYIKFHREHQHFWSPQLHLEIEELNTFNTKIYGVYGPNPTLWTFFMFLHFGVGTVFMLLGIWAYSNSALNKPYGIHLGGMGFLIVVWFVLYALGRAGKRKGKPQMQQLNSFVTKALSL
ncbi:MAG: GTP-binding protein [Maribacter sp.]